MKILTMKTQQQINRIAANHPTTQAEIHKVTEAIGGRAEANLAAVRDEGNSRIEVEFNSNTAYGHIDGLIHLIDEDTIRPNGKRSPGNAKAIEFGHIHNKSGKYIAGKYVLAKAVGLA